MRVGIRRNYHKLHLLLPITLETGVIGQSVSLVTNQKPAYRKEKYNSKQCHQLVTSSELIKEQQTFAQNAGTLQQRRKREWNHGCNSSSRGNIVPLYWRPVVAWVNSTNIKYLLLIHGKAMLVC